MAKLSPLRVTTDAPEEGALPGATEVSAGLSKVIMLTPVPITVATVSEAVIEPLPDGTGKHVTEDAVDHAVVAHCA